MARRSPIVSVLLAAVFLALLPVASASATRIVEPRTDSFFASAPIRVEVRTGRDARGLEATVGGRGVAGAFKRVRPGLWRATLGAKQTRTGVNHLVVSARAPGKRRGYASTRFTIGERKRGLLTLTRSRQGSSRVTRVRVAAPPRRLSAKLNGRRLPWLRGTMPGRTEVLRLGADDGLRFGVNRLQVMAIRDDGAFDVERRTIRVSRRTPLAGAGRDRRAAAGDGVRLDGRSSRAAVAAPARLRYRWKVVAKPRGAKAKLLRAGSSRPTLRADRPGRFRVRLTVSEPRRSGGRYVLRSATDLVTVTAVQSLPPIGQPIETMVYNGKSGGEADTGIRIGARTYWLGMPKGNDFQAVILERETLAPLYAESFSDQGSGYETLEKQIAKYGAKALVVVSVPNLSGQAMPNLALASIAKGLGADVFPIRNGRPGWSVIGVPGTKEGAYLGAGSNPDPSGSVDVRGGLRGYLQETSAGAFAFTPRERVLFETSAPGGGPRSNTIKVGAATYQGQLPECASGGFQAVVLLAETLAPVGEGTFVTNGGGNCGAYDEDEQKRMAEFLGGVQLEGAPASEGPKLVLVQSMGSPYDPAAKAWDQVATALERLGGTGPVFAEARAGYALVGGLGLQRLPLAEASETLTGKAARIAGLLRQDRTGAYAPSLSSPTAGTTYPLSAIAYQPTQPWPVSTGAAVRSALRYAAEDVLKLEAPTLANSCYVPAQPDVRSEYCNLEYRNKWTAYAQKLEEAKFEPGHGFAKPEWEAVVGQLAGKEFETVGSVWNFVDFMQQVFGISSGRNLVDLNGIATEIKKAITPPSTSESIGWWLELFGNFASTGSYFSFGLEGEYVQKVLGALQGGLFETASSIYGPSGEPLLGEFEIAADDLAIDLSERYVAATVELGFLGELLVSDFGKLTAIKESGLLGYSSKGYGSSLEALRAGAKQWSYQELLPAAYEGIAIRPGSLNEPLPASAGPYQCVGRIGERDYVSYNPFGGAPAAAEYKATVPSEAIGLIVVKGSRLPGNEGPEATPKTATQELMAPLFKAEDEGGLNLYKPWFWRQAFEYPSAKTRSVSC